MDGWIMLVGGVRMSGGWMEDGERTEVEEEIIDGGERLEA